MTEPVTHGEQIKRSTGTGDPFTSSPTYSGPAADGPYGERWQGGSNLLVDPENYARARVAQAKTGRNTEVDPRNVMLGRTPEGAQDLRDYAGGVWQDAMSRSGRDFVGYGQDLKSDALAVASDAEAFGDAQRADLLGHGARAALTGKKYGEALDDLGQNQISQGRADATMLRRNADADANRIRGVTALGAPSSAADASFGLAADRALLNAARTGNRAGAAQSMSDAGMAAGNMRVAETNAFRDFDLQGRVAAANTGLRGGIDGATVGSRGYADALTSAKAGADARMDGMNLFQRGVESGYGASMGAQQIAADSAFAGYGAMMDAYEGAADVELGGIEDALGAQDMILGVDAADMRGKMALQTENNARWAAYKEAQLRKEEAEAARQNAWIKMGADTVTTFGGLF
jgi:hypothetical protein